MARRNRSRSRKAPVTPVTVFSRMHANCRDGMHIACPGTVGRRRPQACLCPCHAGTAPRLKAAR